MSTPTSPELKSGTSLSELFSSDEFVALLAANYSTPSPFIVSIGIDGEIQITINSLISLTTASSSDRDLNSPALSYSSTSSISESSSTDGEIKPLSALSACALCGVVLSPANPAEIVVHFKCFHPDEFKESYVAWLKQLDNHVRSMEVKKFRRAEHPVWEFFERVNTHDAVCTLCFSGVRSACSTNLLKHLDYHHPQKARAVKTEWGAIPRSRNGLRKRDA